MPFPVRDPHAASTVATAGRNAAIAHLLAAFQVRIEQIIIFINIEDYAKTCSDLICIKLSMESFFEPLASLEQSNKKFLQNISETI